MRRAPSTLALLAVAAAALPGSAIAATDKEIMLARPLAPTDRNLFVPVIYPDTPPMAPMPGPEPSLTQVRDALDSYLAAEFPGDAAAQDAAKAVFNDAAAESKIPSPSLRAALASLTGTFAEPAIDHILYAVTDQGHAKVTTVKFVPPNQTPDPVRAVAGVYGAGTADPQQLEIRFNNRNQGESPFLFTHIMAHEPLHSDLQVANYEEVVNEALDNLLYVDQVSRHADLARGGSELARRSNSNGLARLNSGPGSRLGLYATNRGTPIFPGGSSAQTFASWWDQFDQAPNLVATPGNALLGEYLKNIHTAGAPNCSAATFDKALLDCIDKQGNAGLKASELVKAAKAMKLDTRVDRKRTLSLSYAKGAFKAKLASAEKPCTSKQKVTVFKQTPGRDQELSSGRTNSSGTYSLAKKKAKGKFYAEAPRSTVAGSGVCLQAKSSTKRVG